MAENSSVPKQSLSKYLSCYLSVSFGAGLLNMMLEGVGGSGEWRRCGRASLLGTLPVNFFVLKTMLS